MLLERIIAAVYFASTAERRAGAAAAAQASRQGASQMRTALLVAILSSAGCAATSAPTLIVEGHPARPWTHEVDAPDVTGSITWYSAADLDRIARHYVRANNIDFSFAGTAAQFWVARDRQYMVRGTYSSGIGKPILHLEIGWDGYVTKHSVGIAVCDIGVAATVP